ncbi:MAG: hypothetical protein FWD66_05165 [Paludibacter sp.]|nr:hypothetical protein [Paludibacter sp.]
MKKWILLILGIVFLIWGMVQICNIAPYFNQLTQMGKGYVVGSSIFIIIGLILTVLGIRLFFKNSRSEHTPDF